MKKTLSILLILISFQSCIEKKKEDKTSPTIDFSGEYLGTFTDIKNTTGSIELTIYQSENGTTGGIISLKKNNDTNLLMTGIINASSDGKTITGNLMPSVVKYPSIDSNNKLNTAFCNSYSCSWGFFGTIIKKSEKIIITGKATPMNCSESNIMNFTITKTKRTTN